MQVKDIMTPNVQGIEASATVMDASKRMQRLNIGALPVFEQQRAIGMITDRDIIIRSIAADMNAAKTPVRDVMTESILSCSVNSSIQEAAELMEQYQVRRLLVRDENDHVSGVISLGDLAVRSDKELSAEALKKISEPNKPSR